MRIPMIVDSDSDDRGQHRSEATLDFVILTKVSIIVKQNQLRDGYNIISGFFSGGGRGGAPTWSIVDHVSTTTSKCVHPPVL